MVAGNWFAPLVIVGTASLLLAPTPRAAGVDASGNGTISGTVTFAGSAPSPVRLDITMDHEVCDREPKFREDLVVAPQTRGLKNVVVWLKDMPEQANDTLPATSDPAALDQRGCRFIPHVVIVPTGETLNILNSDGILHNIHTRGSVNRPINKAQPGVLKRVKAKFKYPEMIFVKCDAHKWMSAWIVVAGHSYYRLTGDDGSYRLDNVPPGTYSLEFWHERLGTATQQVVVVAGKEAHADARFESD